MALSLIIWPRCVYKGGFNNFVSVSSYSSIATYLCHFSLEIWPMSITMRTMKTTMVRGHSLWPHRTITVAQGPGRAQRPTPASLHTHTLMAGTPAMRQAHPQQLAVMGQPMEDMKSSSKTAFLALRVVGLDVSRKVKGFYCCFFLWIQCPFFFIAI